MLIGFALGTLVLLGTAMPAAASGANAAAPTAWPEGIEVIVVSAKRPATRMVEAAPAIEEFVVTAKRPVDANADRIPPVMTLELPKLNLATAEPLVIRL